MIGNILDELRKKVDNINKTDDGKPNTVFPKFNLDKLDIEVNTISLILVNLEEERIFKNPDPYRKRHDVAGSFMQASPPVRLVLYILFTGSYNDYRLSWNRLTDIITFFQKERIISITSKNIQYDLQMEIISQTFSQQNEMWSILKTTQLPSILYRASLIAIEDSDPQETAVIEELTVRYGQSTDQNMKKSIANKKEEIFVIPKSGPQKVNNSG
jgi:hypothetical protein